MPKRRWCEAVVSTAWVAFCLLLWAPAVLADTQAVSRVPLRAAIHVHSTVSTGTLSLESLAQRAERQGLDALILSENFTLRFDYGVRPLEDVLKYEVRFPSVLDYGIERFLSELMEVQRRHPNLILVPGVEIAPHYYWTGSLSGGDLTMHDAQRNLLVIGLDEAQDYASLPARGNPSSFAWNEKSVVKGLPFLLVMPALWLWRPRKQEASEWHEPVHPARHVVAVVLVLVCAGLAINAWPLSSPAFSSYDARTGYRPYQALIDAATQKGGLVFWSMTEARDFSRHSFGPLGSVTVETEPHPESLILTRGYTGFGGLYQDTRHVVAPGGIWDQVLQAAADKGSPAPTMIGEAAFHSLQDAAKDLDRVYTVVQAKERTVGGVLEALQTGHAYAVARGDHQLLLQLDQFLVTDQRDRSVAVGERFQPQGGSLTIRVGISTVDRQPHPARIRIIRSGQVIAQTAGETPIHYELVDREAPTDRAGYYRVEVVGKSGELLTNPIFVAPARQA